MQRIKVRALVSVVTTLTSALTFIHGPCLKASLCVLRAFISFFMRISDDDDDDDD